MTEPIRRPVSQLRAGDLIAPGDAGTVYVVCAISQPVGTDRRAEVVDARTGEADHCVLLPLHDAVLTVPGRARWVEAPGSSGDAVETLLVGPEFTVDDAVHTSWAVEIDQLGHPGWEELVRGERLESAVEAA